jgi:hypothetical protein
VAGRHARSAAKEASGSFAPIAPLGQLIATMRASLTPVLVYLQVVRDLTLCLARADEWISWSTPG